MPKRILEIPNTGDLAFLLMQGKLKVGCTPEGRIFLGIIQEEPMHEYLNLCKPIPYEC